MKNLILLLLILAPIFAFSQQRSEVVEINGKTAAQLYSTANEWFALTFRSANDVIQLNDPAEMKIIAKGYKDIRYSINNVEAPLDMYFTLFVQFKDGRYKYDIEATEIKPIAGKSFSYEELKEVSTVDGVTNQLRSIGASPFIIGKKQIQKNANANKLALNRVDQSLNQIIEDLTITLSKESKDDW